MAAMFAMAGFLQASGPGTSTNLPATSPATSSIEGVWRVDMDGLPAVALVITSEGGSLSGAVLFYLHHRDPGQPWTSSPGLPEPIFNPKFDGTTLTFQVSHRRAHPPRTLSDPPVSFRLMVTGADKAELEMVNQDAPEYVLTKSEY
jgi:hypothetical protein